MALQPHAVDHAALEQERMDRTNDVRERFGPLMERLKNSVSKIQTLENSILLRAGSNGDDLIDSERNEEIQTTNFPNVMSPGQSRQLMNQSMEMVKKKMFRLKTMEEELEALEDRSLNLHHYIQQQLALQDAQGRLALTNVNSEEDNRITELEEQICFLKEKSELIENLRIQNASLLEKAKHVDRLELDLKGEISSRNKLESKLVEHQCKMNKQAVKYENLEGKFQVLTNSITNLTKVLQAQEHSNLNLEQEIMEAREFQKQCLSEHLETNQSVALTDPMSLSATFSSISIDSSTGENDDSKSVDESPFLIEETTCQSTIEILRAKIESLRIENAELRESKGHATKNYESLQEEMRRQSMVIEELRRKLDCRVSEGGE